jgi:cytochrome c
MRVELRRAARTALVSALLALSSTGVASVARAAEFDADAAEELMLDSGCNKCHAVAKSKDGPAYRDVAAKYRGKSDAQESVTHHVTSGEKVKFDDGHEENHKKVKSTDPVEVKNLVLWILSLEGGTAKE